MFLFAIPILPLNMFERIPPSYTCNSFMITVIFCCMEVLHFHYLSSIYSIINNNSVIYPLSFDGYLDCSQFMS